MRSINHWFAPELRIGKTIPEYLANRFSVFIDADLKKLIQDLPDDALVVRGGLMQLPALTKAVEKCITEQHRPGLSVFAGEVATKQELVEAAGNRLRDTQVRFTTVGRLRAAGFTDMEQTSEIPHDSIWLPDQDWGGHLGALEAVFDPPVPLESLKPR